jgi:hypothetical protein
VSLPAVEQAVADTAERAAEPAKTSADGTLQQAIATWTCPLLTPIEYDNAYEGRAHDCAHRQREHIA